MTPITWYLYGRSGGAKKAAEEIGVKESVSGDVASFADGADNLPVDSLVAEITPVQSGSGDPSPTNIRPISGRTGLTVTRAGKNLLNMPTYAEIQAASSVVGYKSLTLNLAPNTTYYLSTTFINGYTANGKGLYILLTNSATTNEPWVAVAHSGNVNGKVNGVMTTGADGILYLRFNGVTEDKLAELYAKSEIQLEVGSTATPYTPYVAPTTYPITWQTEAGTVYGGTLDVVSGVLTVDKIIRQCDADSNFGKGGSTSIHEYYLRNGGAETGISGTWYDAGHIICSHAANYSELSTTGIGTRLNGGQARIYFPLSSDINTLALFKTWLGEQATAGTPLQFCYKLATPQTYQLTPTEVRTILGGNNIYTDAGAVSVEYIADTKMYIDNKIAALQALILEN